MERSLSQLAIFDFQRYDGEKSSYFMQYEYTDDAYNFADCNKVLFIGCTYGTAVTLKTSISVHIQE
jgi:hypothetical protein